MDIDVGLVERCRAGDEEAFEELVLRYQDRVFALVYRMTGDPDRVEDVAQEVFLRAFRALGSFRGGASFYTWLYRIAVNTSLNALRSRAKHRETSLEALDGTELGVDHVAGPDEAAAQHQVVERVKEAIGQLDEQYRVIVYLRDMEEMSYQEIAEVVELPVGTVKSRLFRARQHLKEMLKDILPATARDEENSS